MPTESKNVVRYYELEAFGLKRRLPIVSISPKFKIASVNLLGDTTLVGRSATELVKRLRVLEFDCLVGPEVKVVPLLYEMAKLLGHSRYVICRKSVMGYMKNPVSSGGRGGLVLNGLDAEMLRGKRVVLVDDVVSTGRTLEVLRGLMSEAGAKVVTEATVFKQGDETVDGLIYLAKLPLFEK